MNISFEPILSFSCANTDYSDPTFEEGRSLMKQTRTWGLLFLTLLLACLPVFAQDTTTKGNIGGLIQDSTGAVVADAKVTLAGPQGNAVTTTSGEGKFLFSSLAPGMYAVKVEKQGFRSTEAKGIEVSIGRTSSLTLKLELGAVSEVIEVTGAATTVDTSSTAVGANLADTFYQSVPVARNVASLFYVAPGATDSGGAGHSNPSISGASGLENLYMADGVNITDSAFGGLGVFTRRQGSIGSGINLSFIKEVNVKTGGFEPQYGQATGGVVQLVTNQGPTNTTAKSVPLLPLKERKVPICKRTLFAPTWSATSCIARISTRTRSLAGRYPASRITCSSLAISTRRGLSNSCQLRPQPAWRRSVP